MPELASSFLTPAPRRTLLAAAAPDVEIVVPVYNEAAGLEQSVRRLHRFLTDGFPFTLADRHRRQRVGRRDAGDRPPARAPAAERPPPAARAEGPRPRAARGLVGEPGEGRDLHGRRPLDRPARTAPAGRAADVRPFRPRHRHPPRPQLAGRARPQARVHLPRLQPHPAHPAAREVQRRAVWLQGRAPRRDRQPDGRRRRSGLVLRHRAAGARAATRPADPRGAGRLGRRPRLARRHRPHRPRPTSRASLRLLGRRADRQVHGDRRAEHDRLLAAVPAAVAARWVRSARTPPRSRSPRSPTPRPTAGSPSVSPGARTLRATTRAARRSSSSPSRSPTARSPSCTGSIPTRRGRWRSACCSPRR